MSNKENEYQITANYVKEKGLDGAKELVSLASGLLLGPVGAWRIEYLQQFIESHELVRKLGGLEKAKQAYSRTWWIIGDHKLKQAIADVESCL